MRAMVTGATGFIGVHVVNRLMGNGVDVKALVRKESLKKARKIFGRLDVELVEGDIREPDIIRSALKKCEHLYHIAADYRLWVPDPEIMYEINVLGTKNVMEAAWKANIEKVIYTSTVGVLRGGRNEKGSDESASAGLNEMVCDYKRSKFLAEREVQGFIRKGLPVVIVSPSTPIGPMDRKPTPTGQMIVDFMNGKIRAYLDTGLNFVDVEDVAEGHRLASIHGRIGEKYILGGKNLTLKEFFSMLARITGLRAPKARLPYLPVLAGAYLNEAISYLTRRPPLIPLAGVRMAAKYMYFDPSKAIRELKMPQSPLEATLEEAVDWFSQSGYLKG